MPMNPWPDEVIVSLDGSRARHDAIRNIPGAYDKLAEGVAVVRAMARNDVATVGALFLASHASMRHDYEVSTVEVDTLVELGQIHPAVYGARLTGGGFGGCVVMLVRAQVSRSVAVKVLADYHKRCARQGTILLT